MIKICFFSIVIATAALTLVAAIMNGFERATQAKLQGIHSDLTINAYDKAIDYQKLKTVLTTEYADTVKASSPSSMTHIMVQSPRSDALSICLLKAVDPVEEQAISSLQSLIVRSYNNENPWDLLAKHMIFIGSSLAEQLQVGVGDKLVLYYPSGGTLSRKVSLEERAARIGALFKTGINDFDEHVIVSNFKVARTIFAAPISQVSIALTDRRHEQTVITSLKKRLSLDVLSWKDLYPSLVSALVLEKYAMLFILFLVTLIASLNIISLLFMYVTQKRTDIAVLKAMGMSDSALMAIFVILSACIALSATLCGVLFASLVTALLNAVPFIQLPDTYFASHLPAALDVRIVLAITLLALVVSVVAAFIPARKIRSMVISRVLRSIA